MDDSSACMSWDRITKWKDVVPWGQSLMCYWALEVENLLLHYSQRIKELSHRCRMFGKRRDSVGGLLGQGGRHSKWDGSFSVEQTRLEQNEQEGADGARSAEICRHAIRGMMTYSVWWPQKRGKKVAKNKIAQKRGASGVQMTSCDNHLSGGFGK